MAVRALSVRTLATRGMAAAPALQGVIDGCCPSLPVSSVTDSSAIPRGDSLTQYSPPWCPAQPDPAVPLQSSWQVATHLAGLGKGTGRAGSTDFAGKGSDISVRSTWRRWSRAARAAEQAGCCGELVQPGVRTDPAVAAAAEGTSVGETCGMLAPLHGFACGTLNTCRGFAVRAPEPKG